MLFSYYSPTYAPLPMLQLTPTYNSVSSFFIRLHLLISSSTIWSQGYGPTLGCRHILLGSTAPLSSPYSYQYPNSVALRDLLPLYFRIPLPIYYYVTPFRIPNLFDFSFLPNT